MVGGVGANKWLLRRLLAPFTSRHKVPVIGYRYYFFFTYVLCASAANAGLMRPINLE